MVIASQIAKFYESKKVLITGGTGFMGKVLIWKLLQSCPALDTIFVLIRPKHGESPKSRKEKLFDSPIFNNFKENNPNILQKVVFVSGDVGEDKIGLSDVDYDMLVDQVSIIFHSAAILKMNSPLKTAINVNTVGTIRMLDMAQQMKKLEAFVYVSTAYCCCENSTVEEKIYISKHNPCDIINLIRWMDPELLETLTPKLIYPSPNTYVYSKRLTETILSERASEVPIIVARPSIVAPAFEEPLAGWNDTFNGPVGFFVAAGKGIIRTTMLNLDAKSELIPVDMAINSILVLPWDTSREKLLNEISVYNISPNSQENFTWRYISNCLKNTSTRYPPVTLFWYPNFNPAANNIFVYTIKCIFLHYLPAYTIDFVLLIIGQKPFLVRLHDRIRLGEKILIYFTRRQWTFVHDKLLQLEERLNDTDKQLFLINTRHIKDYQNYMDDIVLATKVYTFKENLKDNDKAKRTLNIMYVVDIIVQVLRYVVLWKILMFAYNLFFEVFHH
ncbi:putative fatty acyl-CoA reductase CG5065 [Planococcus citri]|uniref:putative fatty acyl-CoA reductase CG5065 n=1 Tax=Planococcus citri TaxID=170843 RepID=UPI0031F82CE4